MCTDVLILRTVTRHTTLRATPAPSQAAESDDDLVSTQHRRWPFVCMARGIGVFLCAALAACSSPAPIDAQSGQPRIWDVRAERFVSERQLVADIAAARYRLLGEVHDNPAHHDIRARLIVAIADTGARPAVV